MFEETIDQDCGGPHCSFHKTQQPDARPHLFVGINIFRRIVRFFRLSEQPFLWELREASLSCIGMDPKKVYPTFRHTQDDRQLNGKCFDGIYTYLLLTVGFGPLTLPLALEPLEGVL